MSAHRLIHRPTITRTGALLASLLLLIGFGLPAAAQTTITLSQSPLTVSIPSHPQVLFALGNSESMDGNLSGAIMTGSGSITSSSVGTALLNSSSPLCFTSVSGFTPPLAGYATSGTGSTSTCASGSALYTVVPSGSSYISPQAGTTGTYYDNSPSRLNVAKAGIYQILQTYLPSVDFALEDYSIGSPQPYTTYVYYMSPFMITSSTGAVTSSNFGLTNTYSSNTLVNPCYQYTTASGFGSTLKSDCKTIDGDFFSNTLTSYQYLNLATSTSGETGTTSDNPLVNDVLYGSGFDPVSISYNTTGGSSPSPPNPYCTSCSPKGYTLATYNSSISSILTTYKTDTGGGLTATYPTNAGFIPYADQVMYVERGFAYGANNQSNTTGSMVVTMQSAGEPATSSNYSTALAAFGSSSTANTYLGPESNSTSTVEIKASGGQSSLPGMLAGSLAYYQGKSVGGTTYSKPTPSETNCPAKQYVVLTTDGLPTLDYEGNSWPPLGGSSASTTANEGYGLTATFGGAGTSGALSSTNDTALTDTITQLTNLYNAGIDTYVIGLGAGVSSSVNPQAAESLQAMAVAGGTGTAVSAATSTATAQGYFPATSPAALVSDMQAILQQIAGSTQSVASAAVNSTGLQTGDYLYQAEFSTDDKYQDWTGDLFIDAITINSSTGAVTTAPESPAVSAQAELDATSETSRIIATWQPATSSAVPFEWISCSSSSSSSCPTTSSSGIAANSVLAAELTSTSIVPQPSDSSYGSSVGPDRLAYLRGSTSQYAVNGGVYRNRSHVLGDIVDSNPLYVAVPSGSYTASSYTTFTANNASREPVLYVGANDGMLHAFLASTMQELFAYIPNGGPNADFKSPYTETAGPDGTYGTFGNLPTLGSIFYNSNHLFFMDGSPQAADVQFVNASCTPTSTSASCWHTVLASGEGAGGQTIFAIDVTNPAAITSESTLASDVLWEFSDPNMGYSYSQPAIVDTSSGYAVIFGNGYNSANNKAVLYFVNPQTGGALSTASSGTAAYTTASGSCASGATIDQGCVAIDLCASVSGTCSTSLPEGLSSVTAVNSSGSLSAPADTVYAGDLQGNVWRINISNSNPALWTVHLLFQARDSSGNDQPITTAPAVSLNPGFPQTLGTMVFVGTGELLSATDLSSTKTQTFYGVWDSPNVSTTLTRSKLTAQTLSQETVNCGGTIDTTLIASGNSVTLGTASGDTYGWYVDLNIGAGSSSSSGGSSSSSSSSSGGCTVVSSSSSSSGSTTSAMRVITNPRVESGGGVVFTTYSPYSSQCTAGGTAYLMILNYATGGAFTQPEFILPGNTSLNSSDTVGGQNPVGLSLGSVYATGPTILSANGPNGANALKLVTLSSTVNQTIYDRGGNLQRTGWWEIQ